MADVTWPSISSALDATLAQLDALHAPRLTRQQQATTELAFSVSRLGESAEPWREEEALNPTSQARAGGSAPVAQAPYVPLPERTTHGGPFGPKVRAKLIAEALERR